MKILIISLFFSFTFFAQIPNSKTKIDIEKISYVEILKVNSLKSTTSVTKKISKKLIKDFVQKWNESNYLGADKFRMKFFIDVYFKNGTKRQFSVRDSKIQESGWSTFDIGNKLYFEKIWTELK